MSASTKKLRLLIDLKPALDGYAGIPQESRLLFSSLLQDDAYETHGLLQHGGDRLRSELSISDTHLPVHEELARLSRTVISFDGVGGKLLPRKWGKVISNFIGLNKLRIATLFGRTIELGVFKAEFFEDFLWSRFFSKTLKPSQKTALTKACFRILSPSRKSMHQVGLTTSKTPWPLTYPSINTEGYDYLIAQTPFPGRVSKGTQLIVRYHDAIPIFLPHTISDRHFHQASHFQALKQNIEDGALIACISQSTKQDLLTLFPLADAQSFVINNVVSDEYFEEDSPKSQILTTLLDRAYKTSKFTPNLGQVNVRISEQNIKGFDYLLMVSTLEPRKNHKLLVAAWERLKQTSMPNLKLVVVGSTGWNYQATLDLFQPWVVRGELHYLHNVPAIELRQLYRHAAATICPSVAEGFDYSGIEAMSCGSPVVASDIPVHREIYGKASSYFDAYSADGAAESISNVILKNGQNLRKQLGIEASAILPKYSQKQLLPQWQAFFTADKTTTGQGSLVPETSGTMQ